MAALQSMGRQLQLLLQCVQRVLPAAEARLEHWERKARAIPDARLRRLALASLQAKRFHSHGGSLYAAGAPQDAVDGIIRYIVALQTISDYLDNLCDRTDLLDKADFRTLHRAMLDAVTPEQPLSDYYRFHPGHQDDGYLAALVLAAQRELAALEGYRSVVPQLQKSVVLYNDLQVYKHLPWTVRETRLRRWARHHGAADHGLYWWEFAAATGSTLTVFALVTRCAYGPVSEVQAQTVTASYFPVITAVHILLDYLIDQTEDRKEGDLNFVSYYPTPQLLGERLEGLLIQALEAASQLEDPAFHDLMVRGLPAIYLSDPKVEAQGLEDLRARLLETSGRPGQFLYTICRLQRRRQRRGGPMPPND